jgi:hypothetical protein
MNLRPLGAAMVGKASALNPSSIKTSPSAVPTLSRPKENVQVEN